MARFGDTGFSGTTVTYPLRTKMKPQGATSEIDDFSYRGCPRARYDTMWDFDDELATIEMARPFILTTGNADTNKTPTTNTNVARAYFRVTRPGIITNVWFVGEDGVTQDGTNNLVFTGLNLQTAGDGNRALLDTTAHVNTTDTNASAINGGTNLTAKVIYALSLSGTTAALYVKEGDLLEFTCTAAGTGAAVDAPQCIMRMRTLPFGLKPTVTHTGGATTNVPLAVPNTNTASGEAFLQLSATNEVQTSRLDKGDQLLIDPTKRPIFSCRMKVSGVASVTRFVWGLASAYNATLDNIAENIWFKLDGNSLAIVTETDDNTTDTDDQSTGVSIVADTYNIYRIDMTDPGHIKFWVGNNLVTTHAASALTASMLLQPIFAVQKDSGTGTQSMTVDWARVEMDRL